MAYSGEGHLIEGEIEGSPTKKVVPLVCDEDGHLIVDLDASSITIGTVRIEDTIGGNLTSTGGSLNVNVTNSGSSASMDAVGTLEIVSIILTPLLAPNSARKGLVIQLQDQFIELWLGNTTVPTYLLTPKSVLEIDNFTGAVLGRTLSGSTSVYVTEKI